MKCKLKVFFWLLPFFCLFLLGQDAGQLENQLTNLSLSIRSELSNLKIETALLQNDLTHTISLLNERSADLRLSESERLELEIQRTELITSLENMNERYGNLYESYVRLEEQLAKEKRSNRIKSWILSVLIGLKIIRIIAGFIWPAFNALMIKTKIGQIIDIVI